MAQLNHPKSSARATTTFVDDGAGHRAWVQPLRVVRDGAGVRLRGPFGDGP